MLNLTKGWRSVWALKSSAKGVTGVVSHYSSYPASFREFLAPDAPEHSLLVNTSPSLILTWALQLADAFFKFIFLFSLLANVTVAHLRMIGEALNFIYSRVFFFFFFYSIRRSQESILLPHFQTILYLHRIPWITLNVPPIRNFKLQSMTECSKRSPITAPYIIIKSHYCSAAFKLWLQSGCLLSLCGTCRVTNYTVLWFISGLVG